MSEGEIRYKTDYPARRVVWRGQQFDSQLEADWASTLVSWGIDYVYHPGRLYLDSGGVYEPDFQLEDCGGGSGQGILLEVKGGGNDRIEKAWEAAESGFCVIIGRSGWIPAGADTEVAGAVWEPEEMVVVERDGAMCWSREDEVGTSETVRWTAMYAFARGLEGIRMFKAVGEDGIV